MRRIANFLRRFPIARRTVTLLAVLAALVTLLAAAMEYALNDAHALVKRAVGEHMALQQKLFSMSAGMGNAQTQLNQFAQGLGAEAAGEVIAAIQATLQRAEEVGALSDDARVDDLAARIRQFRESIEAQRATIVGGGTLSAGHKAFLNEGLSRLLEDVSALNDTLAAELRQTMDRELARLRAQQTALSVGGVIVLLAFAGISYALIQSLAPPIRSIQADAEAIAGGDLDRRVAVSGRDEITSLGYAFNHMEEQVSQRTRDLKTIAEIGSRATALRDLDELLNTTVNLVSERFGYYHVQVFLVDEAGENAVLYASTGEPGKALLAQKHRLPVGSESVIGQTTARGEHVIVSDTRAPGAVHRPNPLLPDTRAEMALPLRIGARVIGALDLQSTTPNAFNPDEVHVFQTLADQLANAIDNVRLLEETRARVREIDRLNRQLTREAWSEFVGDGTAGAPLGYRYDLSRVTPLAADGGDGNGGGFTVPIRSRGEVIGALEVAGPIDQLGEDEQAIIEAVAERVGLAVESARLFQQTESALAETRALFQGSEMLNAAATFDEILLALVRSTALGRVERASLALFDRPQVGQDRPEWVDVAAVWRQDGHPDPFAGRRYALDEYALLNFLSRDEVTLIADAARALFAEQIGVRSFVAVPFLIGDEWIGFVTGQSSEPLALSDDDERRLRTLAGQQAALAVQSQLRLQQVQATLSETAVLYDASQALSAAASEQEIVDAIAGYAMESGARAVALLYIETDEAGEPEWAQIVARRVSSAEAPAGAVPAGVGMRFPLRDTALYRMALASPNNLILFPDLRADDRFDDATRQLLLSMGNGAMIAMPLRARGRWVGMMTVGWAEAQSFTERDQRIYRALRDQASITVESRRLLRQTQDTARREQTLREIATRVRSSLDMDTIMRTAVRELGAALGRQTFIRLGSAEELTRPSHAPANGGDGAGASSQGGE